MFLCLSYMSSLPHCSWQVQLALFSPGNHQLKLAHLSEAGLLKWGVLFMRNVADSLLCYIVT